MNLADLKRPFAAADVEWRIARCGKRDTRIWAMVLCYLTNRAIMDRLDEVCGPENWANQFTVAPGGGILCGIEIRIDGGWVTKWDGAEQTDIEAVKGGLSGAMKRAAVQWGIGRYLYNLDEGWAEIGQGSKTTEAYPFRGRVPKDDGGDVFVWRPPQLPEWALPKVEPRPPAAPAAKSPPVAVKAHGTGATFKVIAGKLGAGSGADYADALALFARFAWSDKTQASFAKARSAAAARLGLEPDFETPAVAAAFDAGRAADLAAAGDEAAKEIGR